jgi:hypothetical protein
MFKKVCTAYQVLSDDGERVKYNRTLDVCAEGPATHRPSSRSSFAASGGYTFTGAAMPRKGPTTAWRPSSAGPQSYASRTAAAFPHTRDPAEPDGLSQEEVDQLRNIRTRHAAARRAQAQSAASPPPGHKSDSDSFADSSFEFSTSTTTAPSAPKKASSTQSPKPPPRTTTSTMGDQNTGLGDMLAALRQQQAAARARPSSANGAQRASPAVSVPSGASDAAPAGPSPAKPTPSPPPEPAPEHKAPERATAPSSASATPPPPPRATGAPPDKSASVPPGTAAEARPMPAAAPKAASAPPLSATYYSSLPTTPKAGANGPSPHALSASQMFAQRYNPELRGRPPIPEAKPSTGTRVRFDDSCEQHPRPTPAGSPTPADQPRSAAPSPTIPAMGPSLQPASPRTDPPANRRPSREFTPAASPSAELDAEADSSDVSSSASTPPPRRPFSAPMRRKWVDDRRAAQDAVAAQQEEPAAEDPPSDPPVDLNPDEFKPVRQPVRLHTAYNRRKPGNAESNYLAPVRAPLSGAGRIPEQRPSTPGDSPASTSPTPGSPAGEEHLSGATSPKRVPLGPRVRPSATTPRPSTPSEQLDAVTVPADQVIAKMSTDEARTLVAALEHKLRIARQSLLLRALEKTATMKQ